MGAPTVDHVVINARDNLDYAHSVYRSLGFTLTERGYHSFGSMNHLAVFADNYLELIGLPPDHSSRRDLLTYPLGLNGLVFASKEAAKTFRSLESIHAPFDPPVDFSRPLVVDGKEKEASFSGVFMKPGTIEYGRVYFCFHRTPELIWRSEWQTHDNGATNIDRMTIVSANPEATAQLYAAVFGEDAISDREGGKSLRTHNARIDIVTEEAFQICVGAAAAAAAQGRSVYMAGLALKTSSLEKTNCYFNREEFRAVRRDADRIVVPAHLALNATLEFV